MKDTGGEHEPCGAINAYLLAAGQGRRAEGPKAWAPFDGKTLLERQVAFLRGRFSPARIAVSIQEAWRDRCLAVDPAVHWIPVNPAGSPLACLQSLLKALPMERWGLAYHVDMPLWEAGLFDRLEARLRQDSRFEALIPAYEGRRGHPVILAAEVGPHLLALDPSRDRLDHWLKGRRREILETGFPCVLENWNAGPRTSTEAIS